jgi:hypothetical protein
MLKWSPRLPNWFFMTSASFNKEKRIRVGLSFSDDSLPLHSSLVRLSQATGSPIASIIMDVLLQSKPVFDTVADSILAIKSDPNINITPPLKRLADDALANLFKEVAAFNKFTDDHNSKLKNPNQIDIEDVI